MHTDENKLAVDRQCRQDLTLARDSVFPDKAKACGCHILLACMHINLSFCGVRIKKHLQWLVQALLAPAVTHCYLTDLHILTS